MFEKCQAKKFRDRSADCVLTSRKYPVNFYVWHTVIDFPI